MSKLRDLWRCTEDKSLRAEYDRKQEQLREKYFRCVKIRISDHDHHSAWDCTYDLRLGDKMSTVIFGVLDDFELIPAGIVVENAQVQLEAARRFPSDVS